VITTREIILDTETTGFKPEEGHRIVEIGAVELINHVPTGEVFHVYINPERDMPKESEAVHGLTAAFLKDKPVFADIAEAFITFIGDAPLVIHNASFDMAFINAELGYVGRDAIPFERVVDTLQIARQKFPMAQNSLDALCKRYGVDNSRRTKHGALLDSELLAEVYLELIGGRQTTLVLQSTLKTRQTINYGTIAVRTRPQALPARITQEELVAHQRLVESLGPEALWSKLH
jgi:DNA polymerase III subunit epsilon